MKKMKKVISVLLSITMLLGVVATAPFGVSAAEAFQSIGASSGTTGDCTWTLDNGLLTISGNGQMGGYNYNSTLPWGTNISRLIIEEGVTSVGSYAFYKCTNLYWVKLSGTVNRIGKNAFYGCTKLESVVFPKSEFTIEGYAFYNCTKLESVTISTNVQKIDDRAFYECTGLKSVTVNGSVDTIYWYAFYGCSMLQTVSITGFVESIDYYAFAHSTKLTTLNFGGSVGNVSVTAFDYTAWYNNQPNGMVYLDGYALRYKGVCPGEFAFKDGTETIGSYALSNCNNLTSVYIPATVTRINGGVINNCPLLSSITVNADNQTFDSRGGCNAVVRKSDNELVIGCKDTVIPDSVTSIGEKAFNGCASLTSIIIPGSVKTLKAYAFGNCSGLSEITLPDSVTGLGENVFNGCSNLVGVTLGRSVTTIGQYSFRNCDSLQWVNVRNPGQSFLRYIDSNTRLFNDTVHICCAKGSGAERYALKFGNTYGHSWSEWEHTADPTCTETGLKCHQCSICNEVEEADVPPLGHSLEEVDRDEATCEEEGTIYYWCSQCREYFTETIPASGHDFGEWTVTHEPSCTEDGEEQRVCSHCEKTETRTVEALGHDYQAVVTPPTCTVGGYTTYTCSHCHDHYIADEVSAKGHTPAEAVQEKYTPATCTLEGGYDTVVYCSECGEELSREHTVLEALGHNYGEWTVTAEPSCTEAGEKKHICSRCGHIETSVIDALGHDYDSVVTPPTCTEGGYTTHTCSRCNDSYTDGEVGALGHDYKINILKAPTVGRAGKMGVTCSRCEFNQLVTLPALSGEDYTITNNTATCTEGGTATYTWKDTTYGVYSIEADSPALGHVEETVTGTPATYTHTGLTDGVRCSRCGVWLVEQEIIPKLVSEYPAGDADRDGMVNINDVTTIQRYIAELEEFTDEQLALADINGDGEVNISDATLLQEYFAEFDGIILGQKE